MLFSLEPSYLWLIAGALLLALEAFGAPGVGFLFAGLGAIITAILAEAGIASHLESQAAWFFGLTAFWAWVLWKPLQRFRRGSHSYHNMVGSEATVLEPGLHQNQAGKVRWSGTTMEARLLPGAPEAFLSADTIVTIREVKGNTLIVSPLNQG